MLNSDLQLVVLIWKLRDGTQELIFLEHSWVQLILLFWSAWFKDPEHLTTFVIVI